MPEEMEVPTEHLHEKIHEAAEKNEDRWVLMVAGANCTPLPKIRISTPKALCKLSSSMNGSM